MKRLLSATFLAVFAWTAMSGAHAQNINVKLTGVETSSTLVGPDAIARAVLQIPNGYSVNVQDAGIYTSVTLVGGKLYQVKGMVPGVVIASSANATDATVITSASLSGPLQAILNNVKVMSRNTAAANVKPGLDITQSAAQPTTIVLTNCVITGDPSNAAQTKNIFNVSGIASGKPVSIKATNTQFLSGRAGGNGMLLNSALLTNTNLSLTSCTVNSASEALWWGIGPGSILTVANTTILTTTTAGSTLRLRQPPNGGSVTLRNSTISGRNSAILLSDALVLTTFTLTADRCTITNGSTGSAGDSDTSKLIDLRGISNTSSAVNFKFLNCVIESHYRKSAAANGYPNGTALNFRNGTVANSAPSKVTVYNCTIASGGYTSGTSALAIAGTNAVATVSNTIMANYVDPINLANGATLTASKNNLVVGTAAEASLDGSTIFVSAPQGINTTLAAANLTSPTYIPQAGSPARDAALSSATISTAINSLDRRSFLRPTIKTDIGAFEAQSVPVSLSSFTAE